MIGQSHREFLIESNPQLGLEYKYIHFIIMLLSPMGVLKKDRVPTENIMRAWIFLQNRTAEKILKNAYKIYDANDKK